MSRRFTVINEEFQCVSCGKTVPPLKTGCRNHCPFCLFSLHVDENPGDRKANCGGVLRPIGYETHAKKGIMLEFRCEKCGEVRKNKAARDDVDCPDDYDVILTLTRSIR